MSKILKELGKRLAEREGLQPLRRGQLRPDGYYMGDLFTGKSRIPRGAVINEQSVAGNSGGMHRSEEGEARSKP